MNYVVADEWLFADRPGGSSRVAWAVACAARDHGHRVAYFCGSDAGPAYSRDVVEGITVVRYRRPSFRSWNPLRLHAHVRVAAAAAKAALGATDWDVVHGHTLIPGLAVFSALGRNAHRVATVHSPAVLEQRIVWASAGAAGRLKLLAGEPMLRGAERELLGQAHALTALSAFTRREILAMYGPGIGERIEIVPFWAERATAALSKGAARAQLAWPQDVPVIFTLRRLVRRMGLDTLIEAVHALPADLPVRVYVGGEGSDRAALEARAAAEPGGDKITFLGRMSDGEIAAAYRAADLFVLPSRALECFGIIALEAFAAGCPVIASRAGALPELVGPVMGSRMFDPGDVHELTRLLATFLRGELELPSEDELRRYVEERFSRSEIERAYLDVIERARLVARRRPA